MFLLRQNPGCQIILLRDGIPRGLENDENDIFHGPPLQREPGLGIQEHVVI